MDDWMCGSMEVWMGKRIFLVKIAVFLSSFFYFSNSVEAYKIHSEAGTTSAVFLKIPVSPSYSATSQNLFSKCNDISISFFNPSLLSCMKDRYFYFSHNFHISDIEQNYFAYGNKTQNIINKGNNAYYVISLNYLSISGLEKRSGLNETSTTDPSPVEGKFGSKDIALSFVYGFEYLNNYNLGFAIKFINEEIDDKNATAFAIDLGANREFEVKGEKYNIDFSFNNIGTKMKFLNKSYKLPSSYRFGVERYFESYDINAGISVIKYIDNYPYISIGFDKKITTSLILRGGYRYRFYGNELGFYSGLSLGVSLSYNKFVFDYSLNPYGELGYSHKISLSLKF